MTRKSLKFVVVLLSSFFYIGCDLGGESVPKKIPIEPPSISIAKIPPVIELEDINNEFIGKAIHVSKNLYIAPDHIFQNSKKLFHNGESIELVSRDFSHDLFVFKIKSDTGEILLLRDYPPALDDNIYWFDGNTLHRETVKLLAVKNVASSLDTSALISISGKASPGDSGTPVVDKNGTVIGIIIGTNITTNQTIVVRSDFLLKFLAVVPENKGV